MSLPPLEALIRMRSHPDIGELEVLEEVTPLEFVSMVKNISRRDWLWHNKDGEELTGTFSVPEYGKPKNRIKYQVKRDPAQAGFLVITRLGIIEAQPDLDLSRHIKKQWKGG